MPIVNRTCANLLLASLAAALCSLPTLAAAAAGTSSAGSSASADLKVLQLPIRTDGPKSLDPVEGSTTYDNMACAQFYETLLTGKYTNPKEMEPLLLSEMPTTEDEGTTWRFKLKPDVHFQDNACFSGGKGRVITPDDVFYSLKRLADEQYKLENWWLLDNTVQGLNELKNHQGWRTSMGSRADWLSGLNPEKFKATLFDRELEARTKRAVDTKQEEFKKQPEISESEKQAILGQTRNDVRAALEASLDAAELDALAAEFAGKDKKTFLNARFDYSAPVAGFRKIDDLEFEIVLSKPVYRFLYILSMFQTSVVPHEAVEKYGKDFARNPVGTGPFILDTWVPKQSLTANANPNYHAVYYPERGEWSREDKQNRLHRAAGKRVPFVDRIEFTMFVEDQPMWLEFSKGKLGYTQVPEDYYTQAFDLASKQLKEDWLRKGIRAESDLLLDFTFRGFNMEDSLLGGYTPEKRALRRAISYAIDLEEINKTFYNGLRIVYDGPIPPGLDGHPEGHRAAKAAHGPNLAKARQLLAEAGYPNGDGLPPIRFMTAQNTLNNAVSEMVKRQLAEVNIRLEPVFLDFSTLIENINKKKAPMFGFAWASDYPDAENNLALFYGPNEAPGSNHYNYKRPEFDKLYEQILTMGPGAERTKIYEQMRDMVLDDCVYVGGMARERFYLINPWLLNCKPTERYYAWFKYLDVDDSARNE